MAWITLLLALTVAGAAAEPSDFPQPYSPPCAERENVFEFAEKPAVKALGNDKYEITFTVKAACDVTVGIMDPARDPAGSGRGAVVRHLGSGVLGANAPAPFQKDALKQTILWDGKDDLGEYVKEPGRMQVRVMLGLKPVFDKRLGGTSPKNLPGCVIGMAAGPDAVYVISRGMACSFGNCTVRKFNHDGKYLGTIVPPPANLPEGKLGGMGYVEYEPGKRSLWGADVSNAVSASAFHLPTSLDADWVASCQPVVVGNRLVFANGGSVWGAPGSFLHYINTDGSTEARGIAGVRLVDDGGPRKGGSAHQDWRLAASPDGKTIYLSGVQAGGDQGPKTAVFARLLDGEPAASVFAGEAGKSASGSDNAHFSAAEGIDCDSKGRVYVADSMNNRIQVFEPDRKYLKTIPVDRPNLVLVHKKTGAIYVMHGARVEGRSVSRVTKLASCENPKEEFHVDGLDGLMTLDSWSARPRIWLSGMLGRRYGHGDSTEANYTGSGSVTIWEERDRKLERIGADFEEEARQEAGRSWAGRWNGVGMHCLGFAHAACDPTREKLYHRFSDVFDLATGEREGRFVPLGGCFADLGFDRRGHLHGHQNNRAGVPCMWRVDPSRVEKETDKSGDALLKYQQSPYDYGVDISTGGWVTKTWIGAIATKCQPGAKGFQDGMGVNMRGDIVLDSNIYYVPKMDDVGQEVAMAGSAALTASGRYNEEGGRYSAFVRAVEDAAKKGEETYSIKRQPGIPLAGATIWAFDRTGQTRKESPAVVGGLVNGVQLDEDGFIYFVMDRTRRIGGKDFLDGRAGRYGEGKRTGVPTGVFVKTKVGQWKVQLKNSPIPMDAQPPRPPDFSHPEGWAEGVEWMYAGASPIVFGGCSCPSMRPHLDWYKRSYVPEMYRHSIAILDTNGNLIMHLGRYANFDSAPGGKDGCKPGETDIGMTAVRYVSGTDNYLAFNDRGERLVVLRLTYHAEEAVPLIERRGR